MLTIPPLDKTGSDGGFPSLESSANTASLPRRLTVYRVKPANVRQADFENWARKLKMKGRVEDLGDRFLMTSDDANFEVDKSTGSYDYTKKAFEQQSQPLRRLLTDEEYREKAEAFLNGAGLMHKSAQFHDVNRGNVVGTYENGEWVERPYMVEVRFSHKPLDGIAFDRGVGPKIIVQFGEDGQILGALSVWRDVEPFATYTLKSPEDAVDAARAGEAQLFDVGRDAEGIVDDISLSYMNEPLGYDQRYVLPAYILRGSTSQGRRFTGIVHAIPDAMLRVDTSLVRPNEAPQSAGKK